MIDDNFESNIPNLKEMVALNYDTVSPSDVPPIRGIGILTSGGDAPGMNATIRAVVRAGTHFGYKVFGVTRGFHGLWKGEVIEITKRDVS